MRYCRRIVFVVELMGNIRCGNNNNNIGGGGKINQ